MAKGNVSRPASPMRLDKWLWAARFYKTRSLATDAVDGGKVQLNGNRSKPAREIHVGDRLEISKDETRWEISVRGLSEQRGPAPEAQKLYEESAESLRAREQQRENRQLIAEPAKEIHGRPTKRDRRKIGQMGDW
jgi:ribosome-associated heat shock protein Hsp15